MRTMDFDRIASSSPLDRQASVVRDGSGDLWEPRLSPTTQHWKAPPLPTHALAPGAMDFTGLKVGRLTVIRFHGKSGKSTPVPVWLVRCTCGDYEVRRTETIAKNANPDACCTICDRVEVLKRRSAKPSTKANRKASAAMLDRLAGDQGGGG